MGQTPKGGGGTGGSVLSVGNTVFEINTCVAFVAPCWRCQRMLKMCSLAYAGYDAGICRDAMIPPNDNVGGIKVRCGNVGDPPESEGKWRQQFARSVTFVRFAGHLSCALSCANNVAEPEPIQNVGLARPTAIKK